MISEIPSIWREEVWHPLSVQIPIAKLLLSSVGAFICLVVKNKPYHLFIKQMVYVILGLGVLSG
jgi:hypothetical protein